MSAITVGYEAEQGGFLGGWQKGEAKLVSTVSIFISDLGEKGERPNPPRRRAAAASPSDSLLGLRCHAANFACPKNIDITRCRPQGCW